jgi:8-oxo-dGTP pyrophosphatase MutT (NUDIX family)
MLKNGRQVVKPERKSKLETAAVPVRPRAQVGALPWRIRRGRIEVMLITSRERKRWIIPKGWTHARMSAARMAEVEAWEEAGIIAGECAAKPVGVVSYRKRLAGGLSLPCRIDVYLLKVRRLSAAYPERHERRRLWVTPAHAARLVDEPGLRAILKAM